MSINTFLGARNPATLSGLDTSVIGYWQMIGHAKRTGQAYDLTSFRGVPTQISSMEFSDPFGPKQLTLVFPQSTIFDKVGEGDLDWVQDGASFELIWQGPLPGGYQFGNLTWAPFTINVEGDVLPIGTSYVTSVVPAFRWEGFIASYDIDSQAGLTINCTGAMYQLDRYEAKPEYPARPYPYEYAIKRQFRDKPHLRLKHLQIAWPQDWPNFYTTPDLNTPSYLVPTGVSPGNPWTGLLTRSTGNWEATLTSYIQTILSSMWTANARWTLDLAPKRQPVLLLRDILTVPGAATAIVDPSAPGNLVSLSMDWSQSLDAVYAQGTALDGVAFTGMEVSSDGSQTTYVPFAYRRQVYPSTSNKWLDTKDMPTEVMLQLQQGIDAAGAQLVAAQHLRSFADPGLTGTVTLAVDPVINGAPICRHLIRAGMDIAIMGLLGRPEPTVLHISDSVADIDGGTNTLTVDSKFRDALTVQEVRQRGRDSLRIARMLVGGQYTPPVPDQLVPWSYAKGSGFIPSSSTLNCVELFNGMPDNITFPWTQWTTQRPPSDHRWRNSYIHIGPPAGKPGLNWAYRYGGSTSRTGVGGMLGIPIRMAQSCTVRLIQVAAYDSTGNVLQVPFHISFYGNKAVGVADMPQITPADVTDGSNDGYADKTPISGAGDPLAYYPFGTDAWENFNLDGTQVQFPVNQPNSGAEVFQIYGTRFQQAGMYPGSGTTLGGSHQNATGLLVDESTWNVDTTQEGQGFFDPYVKKNDNKPFVGYMYAMIYCDQQESDVYFLGRIFRVEPGTGS